MRILLGLTFFSIFLTACKEEDVSVYNQWNLMSYVKGPGEVVKNDGFYLKVRFYRDHSFGAVLNTNECTGEFTKGVTNLDVSNITCDSVCCDSLLSIESLNLITDSVDSYNINGNILELEGGHFTKLQFQLAE